MYGPLSLFHWYERKVFQFRDFHKAHPTMAERYHMIASIVAVIATIAAAIYLPVLLIPAGTAYVLQSPLSYIINRAKEKRNDVYNSAFPSKRWYADSNHWKHHQLQFAVVKAVFPDL
ncbi:hypothetical protein PsAD46_00044 [Pseudovibrio sp. Ad46]|uniref:hypothetical protein n=1 Tax=unclassified Pseudovibrio TaxID=2627060 RepID=UPI0007AE96D7|nr:MULTISPECIES: hypothetical protein [unclassified Pseudovibrio]KZK96195.1 hypothetical protein PsAD46_00044 [Pseudovibrio sp. Ad46]KZL01665.1 hypothetical protein PsW74_01775 [Pseudovibrio sp. W74]KZL11883.1 hypothetical protein PsAD14_00045 [Pseudovibrio sp. Ad14]